MPKLELHCAAAVLAVTSALAAAASAGAAPNDTVFIPAGQSAFTAGPPASAAPPPSADDLRALAQERTATASSLMLPQPGLASVLGESLPAIPHGQIPGTAQSSLLGAPVTGALSSGASSSVAGVLSGALSGAQTSAVGLSAPLSAGGLSLGGSGLATPGL